MGFPSPIQPSWLLIELSRSSAQPGMTSMVRNKLCQAQMCVSAILMLNHHPAMRRLKAWHCNQGLAPTGVHPQAPSKSDLRNRRTNPFGTDGQTRCCCTVHSGAQSHQPADSGMLLTVAQLPCMAARCKSAQYHLQNALRRGACYLYRCPCQLAGDTRL